MKSKEQKLEKLKKELKSMESLHNWAWNQYGSELCGNEMSAKEKKLEREIEELEEKIRLKKRNHFIKNTIKETLCEIRKTII